MVTVSATKARTDFYRLLDGTADEPVRITGKRGTSVLLSEEDWNAIQETLFLLSIPGMRESIRSGLKTPVGKCKTELRW